MLAYSVGDDNLIGEDLDSALRSLQNLTAKVIFSSMSNLLSCISLKSNNCSMNFCRTATWLLT